MCMQANKHSNGALFFFYLTPILSKLSFLPNWLSFFYKFAENSEFATTLSCNEISWRYHKRKFTFEIWTGMNHKEISTKEQIVIHFVRNSQLIQKDKKRCKHGRIQLAMTFCDQMKFINLHLRSPPSPSHIQSCKKWFK